MSKGATGKGRTFRSTFLEGGPAAKSSVNKLVPLRMSLVDYEPPKDLHEDEQPTANENKNAGPLKVKSINLNFENNTRNHKTDLYEMTWSKQDDEDATPQLVVRRSQEFTFTINFDRDINASDDIVQLVMEIGDRPIVSKGTSVRLTPESLLQPRHWSSSLQSLGGSTLGVAILTPPDCFIGKWRLGVETSLDREENEGRIKILRYNHPQPIYMIFNPFCRDDTVYMEDEVDLDEYIFNDTGKIYNGNYKQLSYKPWVFGQFENPVLQCCMALLEKAGLNLQSRGNPVAITRAISKIVNVQDDSGVLVGNWSGEYSGGTPPSHWTGSIPILQEYHQTGVPVCFGQCYTFSGLATTVARALGIPTRCITNYSSAHDCDGSITIDMHWDEKGNPISEKNEDSVWTFHCWNEAWMTRPDLEAGYGGWQVYDSTPQETSMGSYCCGPMSVRAIREGNVNFPFDGRFTFAEVNADRVHWILGTDGNWNKVLETHTVGLKISTKRPRNIKVKKNPLFNIVFKDDQDRMDITDQYKFPEGTEAERAAVYKANTFSTQSDVYNKGSEDVKFALAQQDNILVGNAFDVILKVINKTREKRTVHITMSLETTHYTGQHVKTLKSRDFGVELPAIKTEEAVMRVLAEEYLTYTVDQVSFKINILAMVKETKQVFATSEDFRLRRPDLEFECPSRVVFGKPVDVTVKFQNSLPEHLTKCQWMVDGPGLQKPAKFSNRDLEPYDRADLNLTLTPQRPGVHKLIASFTSKELMDVTGICEITVCEG